jgi:3'(2'), 5'-bisphosphate nucleotidase
MIKKEKIFEIALKAGEICLKYFKNTNLNISYKDDNSPITFADKEVSEFLKKSLLEIFPNFTLLSEEDGISTQQQAVKSSNLIVIDPIDGTSSFIKGNKNFTINICIISNGKPIFSLIYQPAIDLLFFADEKFSYRIDSFYQKKNEIKIHNKGGGEVLKVLCTQRKSELEKIKIFIGDVLAEFITISSSIKFCHIAEGKADIYPRMCRIKFWDVAAGFHIAHNAELKINGLQRQDLMNLIYKKAYLLEIAQDNFFIDEFIIFSKNYTQSVLKT